MRHVEFPVESVLSNFDDPPDHGSEGLGRRAFLSASAALVAAPAMGLTTARAAARAVELPAAATQASGQEVVVGPQIPVITNLKDDLALDLDGIRVNVDYLVDHGMVTGKGVLLAAGAGGDFDILTLDERKQVARTIVETADGRVPVIVGVQDSNPDVSIELAKYSESIGAYGVQMSPPYYHVPSDDDVLRLYRRLHDATARVGIMVYNTWWHSYNIPFDVMDQLVDLERVVAIKWSHPGSPFNYAQGVKRYAGRVAVVDNAFMCVMTQLLGGHGFITHLATVWPEHELKIWDLATTGRHQEAMDLHSTDNYAWVAMRGKIGGRTSGESPIVKAAQELTGRPGGPSRQPSRSLTSEERDELRGILRTIGVPNIA